MVATAVAMGVSGPASVSASTLPDGRGYELVSPPEKNGGDVRVDSTRTRAAVAGGALAFGSLASFGNPNGTGNAAEYLSRRTGAFGTQGWSTTAINPKGGASPFGSVISAGMETAYLAMSADLSHAVYRIGSPLTSDPMVSNVANLYVHTPVDTVDPGTFSLLTACPACSTPLHIAGAGSGQTPTYANASRDFGHVVFQSPFPLTADTPPQPFGAFCTVGGLGCQPRAFEWDHGTVRLVGILPDGTAAAASIAGNKDPGYYKLGAVSDDGSKIFFTVPGANDPSHRDQVYMRVNHTTTVHVSASERGTLDGTQAAKFEMASLDGSKVYFTTTEALTDDAPIANLVRLYEYDTTVPDGQANITLISVDTELADTNDVDGVIGASADGSYVYFIAHGQLVAGGPALGAEPGIYLWHGGHVTYVGEVAGINPGIDDDVPTLWQIRPQQARVTPDGKHLLFVSYSGEGLTGYDHGTTCGTGGEACRELYLYSADDGSIVCVSCRPDGIEATSDASTEISFGTGGAGIGPYLNHPLSDDGSRVFFSTGDPLVADDHNGRVRDVYEWQAATGARLLSSGTGTTNSYFVDASADGKDVFFATPQALVGWDTDTSYDFYDARIGGGLPDPPAPTPACTGDTCQSAPRMDPDNGSPAASTTLSGNGNVVATTPTHRAKPRPKRHVCKHGSRRKRVHGKYRCVKAAHRRTIQQRNHA